MNGKWLLISLVALLRSKVNRKVMAEICKREAAADSEGVCVLPWGQAVAAGPSFRLADGVGGGEGQGGCRFHSWRNVGFSGLNFSSEMQSLPASSSDTFPLPSHPRPRPPVWVFLCTLPTATTFTSPHSDPLMPF